MSRAASLSNDKCATTIVPRTEYEPDREPYEYLEGESGVSEGVRDVNVPVPY